MPLKPLIILLIAPTLLAVGNPQKVRLDLKQSLIFAFENSPQFETLKKEKEIATLEEKSAFYSFFPSLDLNTTHGLKNEIPKNTKNSFVSEFSLSLTENLFDNGDSLTKYQISKLKKMQSEINFKNNLNKLSLEISTGFIKFSLDSKLLTLQEEQFKLVQKQYELISSDYHQGMKTRKDFLRFKTQISRGEIDIMRAKTNLENSKLDLKKLLGINQDPENNIELIPIDLKAEENTQIRIINSKDHLSFQSASIQKQINGLETDLVKKKLWPELNLSAETAYKSNSYVNTGREFRDNDRIEWNALLSLKYNIWDWGIRSRDREVAIYKNIIQNNGLNKEILDLESQLQKLQLNLHHSQANFRLTKELLKLEEGNIGLIEREYRNGKLQFLDMIAGLRDLADAQVKYYSALSELLSAEYNYYYHQGNLYENLTQ